MIIICVSCLIVIHNPISFRPSPMKIHQSKWTQSVHNYAYLEHLGSMTSNDPKMTFEPILTVAASRGGMGHLLPQSEALPPLAPSQKKKMAKISHFQQKIGFLPPQNRILPPRCPPRKKFWCRHCLLRVACVPLLQRPYAQVPWKSITASIFSTHTTKQTHIWCSVHRPFFPNSRDNKKVF